jgi:hypothetical protein
MAKYHESLHNDQHAWTATEHALGVLELWKNRTTIVDRKLSYRFRTHFHPWVGELVHELVEGSVQALQAADTTYQRAADGSPMELPDGSWRPKLYQQLFTGSAYGPTGLVEQPYPVKELDFNSGGAYAVYNWELFYHVPISIAIHLSRNGRFEEAQRWFHFVFDPTDDGPDPAPDRYWQVRPFHQAQVQSIEVVLANLSTRSDPDLFTRTVDSIGAWKDAPFRPHLVARYRQSAYMVRAVTAYLDNLIDWGDALFRQDTGESVNEATQLYVLAANLLGPRPQEVPRKGWQRPQTYASLRAELDAFGNAVTELQLDIPFDSLPLPGPASDPAPLAVLRSLAGTLYFCVPRNDKLLGYWDTVADRLFKIRNSLNIQGVFRQLPLFEPPIDPALLAKAAAAGLDVGAIVAGLSQPLPLVRFAVLVAKATEICQEVKSLGSNLLSVIEKEDAEALAIMRARHERVLLDLAEVVRYEQWQEAVKAREGIEKSFAGAVAKLTYYRRLLGVADNEIVVPELDELDVGALEKMTFQAAEPEVTHAPIDVDIASDLGGAGGRQISSYEVTELKLLGQAHAKQSMASGLEAMGKTMAAIPDIEAAAKPMGAGVGTTFGGTLLSKLYSIAASIVSIEAADLGHQASMAARFGGYARREQEWAFQSNLAASEITGIYKQWRAAQIREAIAEREWRNHQQQIQQAEEVERFLTDPRTGKTSSKELYAWLRREVRGLYSRCLQLAQDVARKAERAMQHELGDPRQSFIQYGYQAGREGLLAGEKLYLDLKRMELAYHELNRREYELTTHVSLRQLDPVALLTLRATGACEFTLPEELFDLDCPGHYFRRLRSVALSIPCVTGPYTGVHATLTMQRSTVRTSPALRDGEYARDGDDSERFSDHFGVVESVVTSSGNQDSGLFEVNPRDDRYLPFEGSGAVSRWRLELPGELPQFDHDTISDVVLHLQYSAREGGAPLRSAAQEHLLELISQPETAEAVAGTVRLLSLRHDFPTEWARFRATQLAGDEEAVLALTLRGEHYPFWASKRTIGLHRLELLAESGDTGALTVALADVEERPADHPRAFTPGPGVRTVAFADPDTLPDALGELTLHLNNTAFTELWLVLSWHSQ